MLVGLVALLGAAVYAELKHEERLAPQPLSTLDTAAATQIAVECRGCRARRFERVGGVWLMREPYALAANAESIERLLAIAGAPVRKRLTTGVDSAKIGLDPPVASIRIGERHIDLGTTDAINGLRYLRHDGTIALVPDRYSAWLLAPPESELDRRLAPPDFDLDRVRVDGVEQPALVDAWRRVATSQVVAADGVALDDAPRRRIELVAKNGATLRYAFARGDGRYVALRDDLPLAYPLEEAQAQQLLPAP